MGGCVSKSSFTVNKRNKGGDYSGGPTLFDRHHLERLLASAEPGEFLLYRDLETAHILLSVRMSSYIRHHRVTELGGLYYMQGQPYPYLDSILLYHRRHKLNGVKLLRQVFISARDIRLFAHRVAETNGNFQMFENKNTTAAATSAISIPTPVPPIAVVGTPAATPITSATVAAPLTSATDVPLFPHRVAETNGNFQMFNNKNTTAAATTAISGVPTPVPPIAAVGTPVATPTTSATAAAAAAAAITSEAPGEGETMRRSRGPEVTTIVIRRNSRASSNAPLLTSSRGSTNGRRLS
ncbi:hypothetical protein RRG08_066169 [Elysia crispata]|uniref:SH2 domain-containing protein n=1 Tax=Elysia crispata TaxID=231223 RepID=A0AAE0YL34_9GAST|nr:hypothetical protein RRG08_066169 [Elysia crispata]